MNRRGVAAGRARVLRAPVLMPGAAPAGCRTGRRHGSGRCRGASGRGGARGRLRASAPRARARSSTTKPGCALRAGANGSSTPTCSSCSPTRNQQPPRAGQRLRLRQLLETQQLAVERARRRLAPGRRRDLHVVDPDDRHRPKGLPSTRVAPAQPQLEDTLVSGYARLASDAPNRRIDLELRALDIALASIIGVIALPIALVLALIVLVTSGRPVLYRGPRVGRAGRFFTMLKFRTLAAGRRGAHRPVPRRGARPPHRGRADARSAAG